MLFSSEVDKNYIFVADSLILKHVFSSLKTRKIRMGGNTGSNTFTKRLE